MSMHPDFFFCPECHFPFGKADGSRIHRLFSASAAGDPNSFHTGTQMYKILRVILHNRPGNSLSIFAKNRIESLPRAKKRIALL